ncbi:MAG: sensor histidine kinase [Phycicoccus sp.]
MSVRSVIRGTTRAGPPSDDGWQDSTGRARGAEQAPSALPEDMVGVWGHRVASRMHHILLTTVLGYRTVVVTAINLPLASSPGVDGAWLVLVLLLWSVFNLAILALRWRPPPDLRRPRYLTVYGDTAITVAVSVALSVMTAPATLDGARPGEQAAGWSAVTATVAMWAWIRSMPVGLSLMALTAPVPALVASSTGAGPLDPRTAATVTAVHLGQSAAAMVIVLGVRTTFRLGVDSSLVAGLRTGITRERSRSIRLLHDNAVQTLEGIALMASLAEPGESREILRRVGRAADVEARRLRLRLTDAGTDGGDPWAPVWRAVGAARDRGQVVDARVDGHDAVDPLVTDTVAGIVQEALANAWKHSGSAEAVVRVTTGTDAVSVVVEDQGEGFDVTLASPGFGVRQSIRGRATDVGGRAEVESSRGRGTVVRARIPLGVEPG